MLRRLRWLPVSLLLGCLDAFAPAGAAPFNPPASYRAWWAAMEACAGTTGEFERVQWYACRWGIEVWHRLLHSGGRIAARPLETAERLRRGLALYSVLARRMLSATLLARSVPEAPCRVLLDSEEWPAL